MIPLGERLGSYSVNSQTNSLEYHYLRLLMGLCPLDPKEALVCGSSSQERVMELQENGRGGRGGETGRESKF